MTGRLACVTSQDVGCVGRRRPGGPALSGLLSLRGSGRLGQRHERLSLRSPRSSGRERGLRAGGLVACRRSSFFRLLVFSRLFLPAPRSSSSANRFPVRVVIRSCGAHVLHRAAPTPQGLVLDLNAGRRAPPAALTVTYVVTLRQQPQWACVRQAPPGGRTNMLPKAGLTRCLRAAGSGTDSRLPRCRFTNDRRPRLLTFPSIVRPPLSRFTVFSSSPPLWSCPAARRPVPQWHRFASIGTCRAGEQHAAQLRLNSLPARSGHRNRQLAASVPLHQRPPTAALDPSVHRPSSSFPFSPSSRYFLLCGPVRPPGGRYLSDAGSLRSAPVGRANNMLPNRGSTRCLRAAGTGTDSRLPRWRFTNDRRPRLLTLRPSSVLPSPVSPSSRYFLLCGPVRPPGGRYLSDAGSLRSAPVGRANNMLPNCGSTRCRRAAGSGTDSRLPRCRFTNDRRPRLLTFPSIVRPPLSRFTVFSLFPPLWSCPAARRPVPQ